MPLLEVNVIYVADGRRFRLSMTEDSEQDGPMPDLLRLAIKRVDEVLEHCTWSDLPVTYRIERTIREWLTSLTNLKVSLKTGSPKGLPLRHGYKPAQISGTFSAGVDGEEEGLDLSQEFRSNEQPPAGS